MPAHKNKHSVLVPLILSTPAQRRAGSDRSEEVSLIYPTMSSFTATVQAEREQCHETRVQRGHRPLGEDAPGRATKPCHHRVAHPTHLAWLSCKGASGARDMRHEGSRCWPMMSWAESRHCRGRLPGIIPRHVPAPIAGRSVTQGGAPWSSAWVDQPKSIAVHTTF